MTEDEEITLNPKMDMQGPRGPRTASNVYSTLTVLLKVAFLQNVLWGPRGPQNHLV